MKNPGIYVYATDPKREKLPGLLHLRAIDATAEVSLSFGAEATAINRADNARVEQGTTASGQPRIDVDLKPGRRGRHPDQPHRSSGHGHCQDPDDSAAAAGASAPGTPGTPDTAG